MISGRVTAVSPRSKTFSLKGGLNEQVSNAELKPGELISCNNYIEQDDAYSGYQSMKGYERYDGSTGGLASSIALDDDTLDAEDDSTREARRTAIDAVPDDGAEGDAVQGVHLFNDIVYAWRNYDGTNLKVYKTTTGGWSALTGTVLLDLASTTKVQALNYRFSSYASNAERMYWVDGMNDPIVSDGSTMATITHSNLPTAGAGLSATHIGAWQNRLFLVYPGGHIFFSEVGDPTAWDSATGLAGEIYIGDDVTNVIEAPGGTLVFFTRKNIKILHYGSTSNEFIFKLDEFSNSVGAIKDTAVNLLGTVFFADDKGFTSLAASPDTGGFVGDIIGKNVYNTYNANREQITAGITDRDSNRYYLFYDSGETSNGLVYTFNNKRLKGVSKISLNHEVSCATEGKTTTGASQMYFGTTDGYVMLMNSGTSFDGNAIETSFVTSYHHYGSPRNWKHFQRIQFEMIADVNTRVNVGARFDYNKSTLATMDADQILTTSSGATWGTAVWGSFVWSEPAVIQSPTTYIQGYGRNMSVITSTTSKYRTQHNIQNVTADYTIGSMQQ